MKTRSPTVPKLCGADIELGNFILGSSAADQTDCRAAVALLREIPGVRQHRTPAHPRSRTGDTPAFNPYDWNRRFLRTAASSFYQDQSHAELCLPECISAFDHLASWHAHLRMVQRALARANERLPEGEKLYVLANNSDGTTSWGAHLNFLVTRAMWDGLFHRKLHHQSFLMALQISSIVITGQGKVGASNGAPEVSFQLTQRGDFFETLVAEQTTYSRPLLNRRDEPLCGSDRRYGRIHCIFFDSNLCHVAHLLKVGIMQIGLAMLEAECFDTAIALEDPLWALTQWGHDITLQARARLLSGGNLTAVEVQRLILESAQRFVDAGGCDGVVPRAGELLKLWDETLRLLEAGDLPALARRLDWALKLNLLTDALRQYPQLSWSSPEIRYLDQIYANVDPAEGLYWAYEAAGAVERVVDEKHIQHCMRQPPEDTRAWTRAMLLRAAPAGSVVAMDWDSITFEIDAWPRYRRVELSDPLHWTRAEVEPLVDAAASFEELLDALGARRLPTLSSGYGGGYETSSPYIRIAH
jgi:proteasome accessory factor A